MYTRKITSFLVWGLCILIPIQVQATTNYVIDPYEKIPYVDNETSLGVQVVDYIPHEILAFEVPLYVTCAVVDLESDVIVPTEYSIHNLSQMGDEAIDIAVTKLTVTTRDTKTYWEFIDTEIKSENQINLSIGGVPVLLSEGESKDLDLTESIFYNKNDSKFTIIEPNQTLEIPLVGVVMTTIRDDIDDATAVAQFTVKYTISMLDQDGDPVGIYYEGPTKD